MYRKKKFNYLTSDTDMDPNLRFFRIMKMKNIMIAFGGQAGMGKDTAADILKELLDNRGFKTYRTSFAEGVKFIFCNTFGVERSTMEFTKRNSTPMENFEVTTRQALQKIGDGFREIKKTVWIEQLLERVNQIKTDKTNKTETITLISDLRYENEAKVLKEKGAVLVLIGRSSFLTDDSNASESYIGGKVRHFLDKSEDYDSSLHDLRSDDTTIFDFFIKNDGDIDAFKRIIVELHDKI